jgi:hypothetical protein
VSSPVFTFETGPNRDEAALTRSAKLRKALTAVPEEKPFAFLVPPSCREQLLVRSLSVLEFVTPVPSTVDGRWCTVGLGLARWRRRLNGRMDYALSLSRSGISSYVGSSGLSLGGLINRSRLGSQRLRCGVAKWE